MMTRYREFRVCYADNLRALCVAHGWYTRGTCEEYENLFARLRDGACNLRNLTTELLAEVATDIKAHSDTELEVPAIMHAVARACIVYFDVA